MKFRIIKPALDMENLEETDKFAFERKPFRIHGSTPKWDGAVAFGSLRRIREKPGIIQHDTPRGQGRGRR